MRLGGAMIWYIKQLLVKYTSNTFLFLILILGLLILTTSVIYAAVEHTHFYQQLTWSLIELKHQNYRIVPNFKKLVFKD